MKEYRFHASLRYWNVVVQAESDKDARRQVWEYFRQARWEFGGDDRKGASLRKMELELKQTKEVI
jgi:hypothetical protein